MDEATKVRRACFAQLLPSALPDPKPAEAYAPSNIALSKYWGKRNATLNLPLNSSLSISLAEWGTTTKVTPIDGNQDEVVFNGTELDNHSPFASKMLYFTSLFHRDENIRFRIETVNSIPTAAGLASSASGFAALTQAMAKAFHLDLSNKTLSILARIGSGSASRSFWHGFVRWNKGIRLDGTDSYAEPISTTWKDFRIAILPIDVRPKSQSSRDGMNHTSDTSPLFSAWPANAEADCATIEQAITAHDIEKLGETAEANALAMHATMMAARPSLCYLKPESWIALETIWEARAKGLQAYATMDAGANVKLIFLENQETAVKELFPQANIICPFAHSA
ncbi:MAG: diphosphomevalonate decarboxylase [Pseudomonadota bacterium]